MFNDFPGKVGEVKKNPYLWQPCFHRRNYGASLFTPSKTTIRVLQNLITYFRVYYFRNPTKRSTILRLIGRTNRNLIDSQWPWNVIGS